MLCVFLLLFWMDNFHIYNNLHHILRIKNLFDNIKYLPHDSEEIVFCECECAYETGCFIILFNIIFIGRLCGTLNLINLHDLFESIPFEGMLFWCFGLWICMIFEIWDWAIWIVADWVSSLSFSTKRLREIENTRIEFDAQYSIEIHFSWWKKNRKNVMAKIRAKFIRKELMTPQKSWSCH